MAADGRVRFAGYAAVFDRIDNGGDVVRRGAFARTLAAGKKVPLLWQHRSGTVIGHVERLAEDKRGLRVIASLSSGEVARAVAAQMKRGGLNGLSFGYCVRRAERRDHIRDLVDIDLVEVSVVSNPMQPLARIHAVEG